MKKLDIEPFTKEEEKKLPEDIFWLDSKFPRWKKLLYEENYNRDIYA